MCALVPIGQVRHVTRNATLQQQSPLQPGQCWLGSGTFSIWLTPGGSGGGTYPTAHHDPTDEVVEVPGGVMSNTYLEPCDYTLFSARGYVIELHGPSSVMGASECRPQQAVGRLALANLAKHIPTVHWPTGSLASADLCAAVQDSGLPQAVNATEVTATADHRHCQLSGDGPLSDATVELVTYTTSDAVGATTLSIEGRRTWANLSDQRCDLLIPFTSNPELRRRAGASAVETLHVEAILDHTTGSQPCGPLVTALAPLVRRLG